MNIKLFVKKHTCLTIGTAGLAVIGYIGYRTVCWIKGKCCGKNKVATANSSHSFDIPYRVNFPPPFTPTRSHALSSKTFKADWKRLTDEKERTDEALTLKEIFASRISGYAANPEIHSTFNLPMGEIAHVPGNFSLWMPGVAFVASKLAEKKGLEGLFVCDSLEAFSSRLKKIANDPSDVKCAFIIPTDVKQGRENFPQHKVSVFVEKKAGQLSIALIDPQPIRGNDFIRPPIVEMKMWDSSARYNCQELAYRAIVTGLEGANARLYHSQVLRERQYGCAVYALQDTVAFLQGSQFFDSIGLDDDPIVLSNGQSIQSIIKLPADYLIGVQSTKFYETLKQVEGQEYFDQPLAGRTKTLQQYNDTYIVQNNQAKHNHYITKKNFQYMNAAVKGMETLSSEEFNAIAKKTLITEVDPLLFPS